MPEIKNLGEESSTDKKAQSSQFLDELVKALYDAVVSAQALSERQHQEAMKKYFDGNGNPIVMELNLPSDEDDQKFRKVSIPLVTLASQSSIKIKEVSIEMKVALKKFGRRTGVGEGNGIYDGDKQGAIQADLGGGVPGDEKNKSFANIKVTFIGTEPPEGVLRINDKLIKMIP